MGEGPYSSTAFLASKYDKPVEVFGLPGKRGLWELDGEQFITSITIPRWPTRTVPAAGSDGHADIIDPVDGVIHSFLNLKKGRDGRWTASMYAWTRLDGRGWGDPSHYFQGARAAAVPPMAGLIRKHEINDGQKTYRHALAMSLTFSGLSSRTGYVFPASSADRTWRDNTGMIPEGALMMLPEDFDTASIEDRDLRKVAETLKVYGAYVVDRNHGTPFYIYVENGADFNLHKPKWNHAVDQDLKRMQKALRQVVGVKGWLDGYGRKFSPEEKLNMISMRGPWVATAGKGTAKFDTWSQSLILTGASSRSEFQHRNNRSFSGVNWAKMEGGQRYNLKLQSSEDSELQLTILGNKGNRTMFSSHWLGNGDSVEFTWPGESSRAVLSVRKRSDNGGESRVRAFVYAKDEGIINPLSKTLSR
ncbi:Atrophin-1 multi-domain protein [Limnobacter parvus]|uniref:Atrophin-1 multi-domain protein n=1 Tax=Limnobacter parvus TaxID=2939690 RepID=A0ABT1XF69_9BURK|nr:Atrophin-1 multi-domain protein [Limnobacter parvus]MCR2745925.1 Atrophin-1 multi-domain protein [Limnobacter parvus]